MTSDTEQTALHRISKEDEDIIYQLIKNKLRVSSGDNASVKKAKEKRQADFDAFLVRITPLNREKPRAKGPRRLCYEHIDDIVDITGISYLDLLKALSKDPDGKRIEPQWASEVEASMCSYCDLLSPEQQDMVLTLIRRILAPAFESEELNSMSSILRLAKANSIRSYCTNEMNRQTKDLGVNDIYRRRYLPYSYNALELNMVSYMAASFDVSPHWLMGLDESKTVLAQSGKTEKIMDLFCFLPEERKVSLLRAMEVAIDKGGIV